MSVRDLSSQEEKGRRKRIGMIGVLFAVAIVGVGGVVLYRRVIGEDPDPEEEARTSRYHTLYNRVVSHLTAMRYTEAISTLERAERLFPGQLMPRYGVAMARYFLKNPNAAMEDIQIVFEGSNHRQLIDPEPARAGFYQLRGRIAYDLGQFEQSRSDLETAIKKGQSDSEIHRRLSGALTALGELEEARRSGEEAVALAPQDAKAHFNLGQVHRRLDQLEEAERHLQEAIFHRPSYTAAYQLLGQCLARTGRKPESRRMFELGDKFAKVDDQINRFMTGMMDARMSAEYYKINFEQYAKYCLTYRKVGELSACAKRLLLIDPNNLIYHFLRGTAEARLGNASTAHEHLSQVLAVRPPRIEAMNEMALLLATTWDSQVRAPKESVRWAEKARQAGYERNDYLAVALDAAGESSRAHSLVPWTFDDGEAGRVFRGHEIESFQNAQLRSDVLDLPMYIEEKP